MRLPCSFRTVLAAFFGALFLAAAASAGAPQVKTQAPGFYRIMPGDFEITALSDGILDLHPGKFLTNTTATEVASVRKKSFEQEAVPTPVAASHLPFPGIGRLRAEGKGYVWVPLTYNSVR
jgi:hypothetical protein